MEVKKSNKANLEDKKVLFFQIGLITVLSLLLIAFEWTSRDVMNNSLGELGDIVMEEEIIPITRQEEVKPPPPPPPQVPEILQIVEDDVNIDDELVIDDIEARNSTRIEIPVFNYEEETDDSEEVFVIVEDMPLFMGKNHTSFREWITRNLQYPRTAIEHGLEGTVIISFIIDKDGKVTNVDVIRGVDPLLDNEAARVIGASPEWTPGRQRGKAQRVRFSFPVKFQIGS
jgi:periplasmic protein TonB